MAGATQVHTKLWRPSTLRGILAKIACPVFFLLNRPSMAWFADLAYDFALRCGGIAITFGGKAGPTRAEETFLKRDLAVFKGAWNALRDRRTGMIQFEVIPANITTGATMRGFVEVLQGYRINRLCLNGGLLSPLPHDVKRSEIFITQNLIAVPEDAPG